MAEKSNPFEIAYQGPHYLTGRLVAGYVSQQASDYLRLLAVYKGGTMQSVLQEIIEEWRVKQEPTESIIQALVDRAYLEWVRRGGLNKADPAKWWEYKEEIKGRLCKRKVPNDMIESIIQELRGRLGKNK